MHKIKWQEWQERTVRLTGGHQSWSDISRTIGKSEGACKRKYYSLQKKLGKSLATDDYEYSPNRFDAQAASIIYDAMTADRSYSHCDLPPVLNLDDNIDYK
jgi:hypothetical protein